MWYFNNVGYLFCLGLLSRVSSSNRLPGSSWQSQESLQSSSSKLLQQQFGSVRIADQVSWKKPITIIDTIV